MPYRVDVRDAGVEVFDRLVELGALDVEPSADGGMVAVMPDTIAPEQISGALGIGEISISPAVARDAGSVWILRPRTIHIGRLHIVPADSDAQPLTLRLIDSAAFGTGLHPTTALCLEMLDEIVLDPPPDAVLDVGTGSGVLALAALTMGVPRSLGIDVDVDALRTAAENARLTE